MPKQNCRCTYEPGDTRCDVHPICDYCGKEIERSDRDGHLRAVHGAGTGRYCSIRCRDEGEVTPCPNYLSPGDNPYASGDVAYTGCSLCGRSRSEHR